MTSICANDPDLLAISAVTGLQLHSYSEFLLGFKPYLGWLGCLVGIEPTSTSSHQNTISSFEQSVVSGSRSSIAIKVTPGLPSPCPWTHLFVFCMGESPVFGGLSPLPASD